MAAQEAMLATQIGRDLVAAAVQLLASKKPGVKLVRVLLQLLYNLSCGEEGVWGSCLPTYLLPSFSLSKAIP